MLRPAANQTKDGDESFSRSLYNTRMAILPSSFWPCHSKFKRPIMSATLKGNLFYQLTSNFIFANILIKIQIMKITAAKETIHIISLEPISKKWAPKSIH